MLQRTLTILKPDTVSARRCGAVIDRLEREGFAILGVRTLHLTQTQAEAFYAVHRQRPFFASLVKFMTEGPIWVLALERENAVVHLRTVMGATNPANADPGTIRADFATSIERNAIHGSDSPENAALELAFFFPSYELV
ncbi:MAG: nucleoside-diphosphate kinase [Thermoanaerobaculaceae bacterium]|nr:nucleoside-diphosphate kinase [Thermoanaerobaculaceae bacterium]MDI9621693.1 nucleoside-diphosphate kinase [Acidobacteriota bacterium]NLH11496.1 nucleoside-diphosphate kinase [Holophagae bacterium]